MWTIRQTVVISIGWHLFYLVVVYAIFKCMSFYLFCYFVRFHRCARNLSWLKIETYRSRMLKWILTFKTTHKMCFINEHLSTKFHKSSSYQAKNKMKRKVEAIWSDAIFIHSFQNKYFVDTLFCISNGGHYGVVIQSRVITWH